MSALDTLIKISNTSVINASLKYCFVTKNKIPMKTDNTNAKPNNVNDFVNFEDLVNSKYIDNFAGVGISIQASNVCAIDVDKCFSKKNDISSADSRAKNIISLFKDVAYIEFSFSGTGLRVIFRNPMPFNHQFNDNYLTKYYIKNDKNNIEFYQPNYSYRYVTLTGNVIYNNNIDSTKDLTRILLVFLDEYMKRPINNTKSEMPKESKDNRSLDEIMKLVKYLYLTDAVFQDLWFNKAPGSGKDESQRDYHLIAYLYQYVSQDKDKIKQVFEQSNFFKTKDSHHMYKWNNNNFRYYNYVYEHIRRK